MTREEAIENLKILKEDYWDDDGYGHETKQYDDTMLALDVAIKVLEQEPKTGHWIKPRNDDGMSDPIYYQVRCSECGFDLDPQTWYVELHQYNADKYCPNCGCRMVEPQESEE